MLPATVASLLLAILSALPGAPTHDTSDTPDSGGHHALRFELRHLHAVSSSAQVVFADIVPPTLDAALAPDVSDDELRSYSIRTRNVITHRPPSLDAFDAARLRRRRPPAVDFRSGHFQSFPEDSLAWWYEEEVIGPNVESRETLLVLAKMTTNAYVPPDDPAWYDLGEDWTVTYPVGWEPDADGFRGHVFATPDNSTIVLSIKGTSAGWFGNGGSTTKKDKQNDNLLFSCCCAHVDWTWTTVCDCYRSGWKCDIDCVQQALVNDSLFYPIGTNLYNNLTYLYPDANIWVIGHSLGGALASLLGVTFGVPVVTFESPGERMASSRLHLPSPPSTQHITHVYHTADPIAMGTCTGVLSSCAIAGFAMESRCHLGLRIVYDTVSNLSWSVDARTHGIVRVISDILSKPWPPAEEIGREVPVPVPEEDDCVECYSWDFGPYPKSMPADNGMRASCS